MSKLDNPGFKAISNICTNFSAVFLASIILPLFIGGLDLSEWPVLILGTTLTISSGFLSVLAAERGNL